LKILGIDPGTRVAGFAVIECDDTGVRPIDMGVIRLNTRIPAETRVFALGTRIERLIEEHCPEMLAVEKVYIHRSADSALKLKMANAIAIDRANASGIRHIQISPSQAKKVVTGNGGASKNRVRRAVQRICRLPEPPISDAADAVAIAICAAAKMRADSGTMYAWTTSKEA